MAASLFSHQFLIAMPGLLDPNFRRTLTYVFEHSVDGAIGIVINQPLNISFAEVMQQAGIESPALNMPQIPVYKGGPIDPEHGFIVHQPVGNWEATIDSGHGIGISRSRDVLQAMAEGNGPDHALVALGYAGWGAGQLETEISENAWLTCAADSSILFADDAAYKLDAAAASLGVNLSLLAHQAGHA